MSESRRYLGEVPRGKRAIFMYHPWFSRIARHIGGSALSPLMVEIQAYKICQAMRGTLGWLPPDVLGMAAENGPFKC